MKVVVLNGGMGTRLGFKDGPKPMVPLLGVPLLERILENGKGCGFSDYLFLNGYQAEVIESHFGDGSCHGVSISHVREISPLGTAGAVRAVRHLLTEAFVVLYGDILIGVDLSHVVRHHVGSGALATLFVHPTDHPEDSDLVEIDEKGCIRSFLQKPRSPNVTVRNLASCAIYVLDPRAVDYVPQAESSDWGHDVFPKMLSASKVLNSYYSFEYTRDIGTINRLKLAESDLYSGRIEKLRRKSRKAAIFINCIDLLGVMDERCRQHPFVAAGVREEIAKINRSGIPLVGLYYLADAREQAVALGDAHLSLARLDTELAKHCAYLNKTYLVSKYGHLLVRKPSEADGNLGSDMALALCTAADDHHLELARSWLVTSCKDELRVASSVGVQTMYVGIVNTPACPLGSGPSAGAANADLLSDRLSAALGRISAELS